MKNYEPLTEEDYNFLKTELRKIGVYLPQNLMRPMWNLFNKLHNTNYPMACACPSSGGTWMRAVESLRVYVNKIDEQIIE